MMKICNTYKTLVFIVVTCFAITCVSAQEKTPSGKPNRFVPYSISEHINSSYSEVNPVFSKDGATVYFSRIDHPENHYGNFRSQDIWCSELGDDGQWGEPYRLDVPFNRNRYNAIYSITADGDFLVSGIYNKGGKYKKRGLSFVHKTESSWSLPERLRIPKTSKKDRGLVSTAYLSKDGEEILFSYTSGWQQAYNSKIRYSYKKENGHWKTPKVIKNKELSRGFRSVETPFLSDDGTTLYFSSYGSKKYNEYKNDIYKMSRSGKSLAKWSDIEKVDEVINTSYWENYFKLFNEDNWAVFTKADVGDDADIFIVKLREPKPYVDLHGIVKLDNLPLGERFEIMINGQLVDSVRIDRKTSSYAVQLPLGMKYELQAKAKDKEAKIESIDATEELEYLPMEMDLELSLLPFLDLSGEVTVYGELIGEDFEILIDGQSVDSVKIDTLNSTYSVKLPLGRQYELEVRFGNYIPEKTIVDVTAETRQVRTIQNLKMTTIPYVDITGQLFNSKTNIIIPQTSYPKVFINGLEVDSLRIGVDGYQVRLPWGSKYVFHIVIDDFAPIPVIIDLVNDKNYRKIKQDLFASPLEKYATLTGKVINMKTKLSLTDPYKIEVNGAVSTTGNIDVNEGSYEVRLSLGQNAIVTAISDKYFPISEVIDLSNETENVKVLKDLYVMPLEVGEGILLNNIIFETGSTNLKPESFSDIDRVVDLMRLVSTLKIEIQGHTDSSGKDAFNLALSNSRARSVVDYIRGKGLGENRVKYKGLGEADPVASNLTAEGRAKNRRVEFVILER